LGVFNEENPFVFGRDFRFGSWSCENAPADALTADDDLGEVVALGRFAEFGAPGTDSSRVRRLSDVVSQSEDIDLK
jgi:hypothetical protein